MNPQEIFSTYADYYAYAVDMHRKISNSLDGLREDILTINDYLVKNNPQGPNYANILAQNAETTRVNMLSNFSQIAYVENSFVELSKYVKKKFNTTVDGMLTTEDVKVFEPYAKTSTSLGEAISSTNIKSE